MNLATTEPLWKSMRVRRLSPEELLFALRIQNEVPVPIWKVLDDLDIVVHRVTDEAYSGAARVRDDKAEIWVNTKDPQVRQRFTAAHELGHVLLMHADSGVMHRDYVFGSNDQREREANKFAAALLMPELWVWYAIRTFGGSLPQMARFFNVSEQAMGLRVREVADAR